MSNIKNIEKIPEEVREVTQVGLTEALKRGSLGKMKIDFVQIENSLSGGKTGAVVFVARYGVSDKTTFVRVLKIAPKEICESENEGYVKTRETLLDIFSQVEYYTEDEFVYDPTTEKDKPKEYGILLYQDVGTVAASDLKGIARYFTNKVLKEANENKPQAKEDVEKFSRELSLLMQKEVFLGLKKGLYGTVKRRDIKLSEIYGNKIKSEKVKQGLAELKEIDPSLPDLDTILNYFDLNATYHEVNFIHGDLNPENVLVWENERGFLNCKLIDFGEVMPKKKDNFTPLFWDYSRLLGEMILNFVEEIGVGASRYTAGTAGSTRRTDSTVEANIDKAVNENIGHRVISDTSKEVTTNEETGNRIEMPTLEMIDNILNEFWTVVEAFFRNDPSKLENANPNIEYISRIYLSTLFDFINEAKSGIKDLRRAEVMQDYFYCQILFFLFFAKFQRENPFKRLFGVKFALKLYEFVSSGELGLQSLILSLEKFYFEFSSNRIKNKAPQIGPLPGAISPFMGLKAFHENDRKYFFGREKFTEELVNAVGEKPIIALAGASGSGKSSVVYAGVIPKLREEGYLVFKFRPGTNPYLSAVNCLKNQNVEINDPSRRDARRASSLKNESANLQNKSINTQNEWSLDANDDSSSDSVNSPLKEDRPPSVPTLSKMENLSELIRNILKSNPEKRLFLLGDQFEEMFTLSEDSDKKEELGIAILEMAKEFPARFRFFITIRSDFWTKFLEDSSFSSVVGDSGANSQLGKRFFLSPMTLEELRSTIEKPLEVANLKIQEGLTDLILTSISKEPGSLPLLEFCLEELWKKQVDETLTYEAYKEIGEVKGALATYADHVYSKLEDSEKGYLKKIMLQLVQPGQGTEDTRRIALVEEIVVVPLGKKVVTLSLSKGDSLEKVVVPFDKLRTSSNAHHDNYNGEENTEVAHRVISDTTKETNVNKETGNRMDSTSSPQVEMPNSMDSGLQPTVLKLTDLRLITTGKNEEGKQTLEVVHEALIREWKTLREWINADREFRVWQEKLRYAEKEWSAEGKEEEQLLAGSAIVTAEDWYNKRKEDLSEREINYIEASIQKRNLEIQAKADAEKRKKRVNRIITFASVAVAIFAIGLSWFSYAKMKDAETSKELAEKSKKQAEESAKLAKESEEEAKKNLEEAEKAKEQALESERLADEQKKVANSHLKSNILNSRLEKVEENKDNLMNLFELLQIGLNLIDLPDKFSDQRILVLSLLSKISNREDGRYYLWQRFFDSSIGDYRGQLRFSYTRVSNSPDGKTIVIGSRDTDDKGGAIRIWNTETNKLLKSIGGHINGISALHISPNGKTIASGSKDKTIKLWDIETGELLKTLSGHNDEVANLSFSPDGKKITSVSADSNIKFWDSETGELLKSIIISENGEKKLHSWAFSPNCQTIAAVQEDKTIKLWDTGTGELLKSIKTGHTKPLFSPNGKIFASVSKDNTIKLWDVSKIRDFISFSSKELKTLSVQNDHDYIKSVTFSPDGKTIASGYSRSMKIWDIETGKEIQSIELAWDLVGLDFSPDGKKIVVYTNTNILVYSKIPFSLPNIKGKKNISTASPYFFNGISFSPDGKKIASKSEDNNIGLWDINTGKKLKTFAVRSVVERINFSPYDDIIASSSELLDVNTGKILINFPKNTQNVSFSPDRRTIASISDNDIKLWDIITGKKLKSISNNRIGKSFISFSPDGRTIASISPYKFEILDTEKGKLLKTFTIGGRNLHFARLSNDGKSIITIDTDGLIRFLDSDSGTEIKEFSIDLCFSIDYSMDGKVLVLGLNNRILILNDLSKKEIFSIPSKFPGAVTNVKISPDGKTLAYTLHTDQGQENTIYLLNISLEDSISNMCQEWNHQFNNFIQLGALSPFYVDDVKDVQEKCAKYVRK